MRSRPFVSTEWVWQAGRARKSARPKRPISVFVRTKPDKDRTAGPSAKSKVPAWGTPPYFFPMYFSGAESNAFLHPGAQK